MENENKVATDVTENDSVKLVISEDVVESSPATIQEVEDTVMVTDMDYAINLLKLGDSYDVPTLLGSFENEIHTSIDDRMTRMLKPLTEAKNILLRHAIEQMIAKDGRFDVSRFIPYKDACDSCHGTGELYKFFRKSTTVPCKFCDGEKYVIIKCRACKGTTRYRKRKNGLGVNVECSRCTRDPETKMPTGQEKVKCRHCLAKGTFRKLIIDSKIKSTTHCRKCKGRGFLLPEPTAPAKKTFSDKRSARPANLINPVISADLGKQLKRAKVIE